MRFLRYKALKSVMGPGRVGSGREYSDFSLQYERTRSARCARSLVTIRYLPRNHWNSTIFRVLSSIAKRHLYIVKAIQNSQKLATYRQVWRHWKKLPTGWPQVTQVVSIWLEVYRLGLSCQLGMSRAGPACWARLGRAGRRPSVVWNAAGRGEGRRQWQVTNRYIRVGTPTYREGFPNWKNIERMTNTKETWAKGAWGKVDT